MLLRFRVWGFRFFTALGFQVSSSGSLGVQGFGDKWNVKLTWVGIGRAGRSSARCVEGSRYRSALHRKHYVYFARTPH